MRLPILLVVVAACGGTPKPPPAAPLPDDTKQAAQPPPPAEPSQQPDTAEARAEADAKKKGAHGGPPAPSGPIELKIPAVQTAVKVVAGGKGKKQVVRYTATPGAKQAVELALDLTSQQDADQDVAPTIVLTGEAEAKTVENDGSAEYTLTVTGTDAREAAGTRVPLQEFKAVLGSLAGLTIGGKRDANGAAGEVTLRIEHPPRHGGDVVELVRIAFPALPVLPTQALGVGAKWQATTTTKFVNRLEVTQVTDYELIAHKGTTWTVKGTTKITGKDQDVDSSKISEISGGGSSETTIADGALYPTHKASVEVKFKKAEQGSSTQHAIKVGGAVTPK